MTLSSASVPSPTPARAGTVLGGRYRLLEPIGRGGMGEVWKARDSQLEREVAAKLPAAHSIDEDGRNRILREARLVASLNHPGIVAVHDAGVSEGQPFVIFELVAGRNLREQPRRDPDSVRSIAEQVLEALAHVHANAIVHRDLKPENLLWADGESGTRIKIADLGIAFSGSATTLAAGSLVGTAAYLAPEQALGGAVDGRADLYALGAVLYELIAGRPPFEGVDLLAVVSQHVHAPVPPLRLHVPDVDPALEQFVLRLLEKSPEQRFPDAKSALDALHALAGGAGAGAAAPAAGAPIDQLVRGRLIGRGPELERLRATWKEALAGHAQLVLLSGEPGVGKTRLARELVVAARVDGAVALAGGCYEFEATTPYLPFVEALTSWARDRSPESMRQALGETASELARLVPEIDARLGPFPPAPGLQPHEERLRLFEAVTRFLRSLAAKRGVLLLLDDLHWADTGTLALVRHALRQLRGDRVLMLGTYREIELDRRHPLAAALVEWDRERISTRVSLGRLSRADSGALLATLLHQDTTTEEFGDAMHRETEGNPFFVEEVVKALIEQGQIYREGGEWQRRSMEDLAIPQSVKAAIGHRLDRLSEGCAGVLHVAAVLGKVFEFPVLLACAGVADEALLDALDEAAAAQLVTPLERESFAFTHDKIREVLIEELNPIRLRRLHLKIAEVLASRSDARPEDLSYHFLLAGELAPAMKWSLAASERAASVFALAEAANHLARARECAEALGDPAARLEVLGALARLHNMRGDAPATMAACREALPLCHTAEERLALDTLAAESAVAIAHPDAEKLIDAAEADLPPGDASVRRAMLLGLRGRVFHYRLDHTQAFLYYERALALPSISDDPEVEGRTYSFMAGNFQQIARFEESMKWAQRCVDLGRKTARPEMEASGHEFLAEDLNALGRSREALEHAREDMRLGLRAGSLDRQAWGHFCAMWANLNLGALAEVLEGGVIARELCEMLGEQRLLAFLSIPATVAAGESGDEERTDEWIAVGLAASERVNQLNLKAFIWGSRARVAIMRGDLVQGLALAREGLAMREGSPSTVGVDRLYAHGALAAALTGEMGTADAYAKRGLEFCETTGSIDSLCVLHRAVAATALARRRPDETEAQLAKAIATAESSGQRLEQAYAMADRVALARTMSREPSAQADVTRARELAESCGAKRLLAQLA